MTDTTQHRGPRRPRRTTATRSRVDGEVAGFAVYHRRGGRTYFVHTEIDPAFEGKGLGSTLAKGALDAERAPRRAGRAAVPVHPRLHRPPPRVRRPRRHTSMLARIDGDLSAASVHRAAPGWRNWQTRGA